MSLSLFLVLRAPADSGVPFPVYLSDGRMRDI